MYQEPKIIYPVCLFCVALTTLLSACLQNQPDPRSIDGVIAYASNAIENDDPRMLFRVIDAKSRHALFSIVTDRHRSKSLIESSYPASLKAQTIASLGDAAQAHDAADLFAQRCLRPCRQEIGSRLGAPQKIREDHDLTIVLTTRGELKFRKSQSWYGIVWRTEELFSERDRANRDLHLIELNAETYRRQSSLER